MAILLFSYELAPKAPVDRLPTPPARTVEKVFHIFPTYIRPSTPSDTPRCPLVPFT